MFDNICKYLAEQFSADLASWLLGQPITLTKLSPTELSLEPIRADTLILLQSDTLILHAEFQTDPDPTIPFRLLDYRVRIYRRFPNKDVQQVVVYLPPSRSPLVYQNRFELSRLQYEFRVIRLWEQETELFLQSPGLLPFAVLTQANNQEQVLQQVGQKVAELENRSQQSDVAASASILAGLVLKKELIQRVLRQELMRESVIYQEIKAEGIVEGKAEGIVEGKADFAIRLLQRRVGTLPRSLETRIQSLSLPQLEALGDALLDFSALTDLQAWLNELG